jgi:hypothetical protein
MCPILSGLKILRDLAGEKYIKLQLLRGQTEATGRIQPCSVRPALVKLDACGFSGIQYPKTP